MVNKTDLILKKIDCLQKTSTKIQVDVAGIKGHLKTLNGNVARHESILGDHSKDIIKMKGVVKYFIGIGTTLVVIATFFGDKIRKVFSP